MLPFIRLNDFTRGTSPLPSRLLCPQVLRSSSKAALLQALSLPSLNFSPRKVLPLAPLTFSPPHTLTALYSPISVPFVAHYSLPEQGPRGARSSDPLRAG